MRKNTKRCLESNNIYFESVVNKEELYKEGFDIHIDDELGDILKIKSYAESKCHILFSWFEISTNPPIFPKHSYGSFKGYNLSHFIDF